VSLAWLVLAACMLPRAAAAAAALPVVASGQQEYWAQFDKRDWDAAIAAAETMVTAARAATTDASSGLRLADTLVMLGNALYGKGNLVAAEKAFQEALDLTGKYTNRSSARLVDPLRGLGFTLAAQGKHERAIPYMDRALLLSRRSTGLFNVSQEGLLRQLANSLAITGSPVEGEKHMLYLLRLGEHEYGEKDARMVPVYCTVARWYADVAQMDQARSIYRKALSIAERSMGRDSTGIVVPLRGLAQTFPEEVALNNLGIPTRKERLSTMPEEPISTVQEPYNPRYIAPEGERALLRALRVLDADPHRSTRVLIETLVQTGDWFLLKDQSSKAMDYYSRAAALIGENTAAASPDDDGIGEAAALLSFPVAVYYLPPPAAIRNLAVIPYELEDRYVQVEFTVLPDGSITDERETGHDGTNRHVVQTLAAISDARYRPRFVKGEPVVTTNVGYRQIFKVRKHDQDDADD
jgi:tetratricopeptide (TPR) repeat protein